MEELQKAKTSLEAETAEQRRELEVSENDKTVLRDALRQAEEEKNGLALDLAETSKVQYKGYGTGTGPSGSISEVRILPFFHKCV